MNDGLIGDRRNLVAMINRSSKSGTMAGRSIQAAGGMSRRRQLYALPAAGFAGLAMAFARELGVNRFLFALLAILFASASPLWADEVSQKFVLHDTARPLPEIRFEDAEAKPLSLANFQGKIVLLNIWATWCGPCRKEMPTLDRLQAKLGGADFEVVALSIDEGGADLVRKFYAEIGIQQLLIYMHPSSATPQALGVVGIPTTLLIDRRGQELGRLVGPAEWDAPEMISLLESVIARQADSPSTPQQQE